MVVIYYGHVLWQFDSLSYCGYLTGCHSDILRRDILRTISLINHLTSILLLLWIKCEVKSIMIHLVFYFVKGIT